jgi:hypothetical protein
MEGDIPMTGQDIYFPSQARMFLDNMTRNDGERNVSRQELARISGSKGLHRGSQVHDRVNQVLAMWRGTP